MIGQPFGNTPAPDWVLFLLEGIAAFLLVLICMIQLQTSISDTGITYRFYPFQLSTTLIEWEELSDAYMREYNSFYEFGGWGMRVGNMPTNRALNTRQSGNIGLQLEFKDGRLLLIGTTKPESMQQVLTQQIAAGHIRWGK